LADETFSMVGRKRTALHAWRGIACSVSPAAWNVGIRMALERALPRCWADGGWREHDLHHMPLRNVMDG